MAKKKTTQTIKKRKTTRSFNGARPPLRNDARKGRDSWPRGVEAPGGRGQYLTPRRRKDRSHLLEDLCAGEPIFDNLSREKSQLEEKNRVVVEFMTEGWSGRNVPLHHR